MRLYSAAYIRDIRDKRIICNSSSSQSAAAITPNGDKLRLMERARPQLQRHSVTPKKEGVVFTLVPED